MSVLTQIITPAYRLFQQLGAPGRGTSTEEQAESLAVLNTMIDSWLLESLMVYSIQRIVQNITAGKRSYTVGLTGDWSIPRPVRIERASLLFDSTSPQPLEL